jgi:hypothetical protein
MSIQGAPIHYTGGIIDMGIYNGRVDVIGPPSQQERNQIASRSFQKNASTPYAHAIRGIWHDNILSDAYFSQENIQIIQNGIRAGVYQASKEYQIIVPPQNIDVLKIIMRSIFLQYSQNNPDDIRGQIKTLNNLVLDYCVPDVLSGAIAHQKYLQDQSTLVVPIAHAQRPDKEWKQLLLRPFVDEDPSQLTPEYPKIPYKNLQVQYVSAENGTKSEEAGFYKGGNEPVRPFAKIVYHNQGANGIAPPYGSLL